MDYEADFHAWTQAQAAALRRAGDARVNVPAEIDWAHVAEELESMGASERAEIESRLQIVLEHLLKLAAVRLADPRNGWRRTVRAQRDRIDIALQQSPSLRSLPAKALSRAYIRARRSVAADYPFAQLPATCPFDLEREVLTDEWFPPEPV